MEPETAAFLRRIVKSIAIAFCWLAITATAAIKGDNAFVNDHITIGNILFYLWVIISVIVLIQIYKRMWFTDINS